MSNNFQAENQALSSTKRLVFFAASLFIALVIAVVFVQTAAEAQAKEYTKCDVSIVNGRSVHPGTAIEYVTDKGTYLIEGIEDEAYATTSGSIEYYEASSVVPSVVLGDSGISSHQLGELACDTIEVKTDPIPETTTTTSAPQIVEKEVIVEVEVIKEVEVVKEVPVEVIVEKMIEAPVAVPVVGSPAYTG